MSIAAFRDFSTRRSPNPSLISAPSLTSAPARARKGIVARISAAIDGWHQRNAEKEAARFIAEHGGRLTDSIERQLNERLIGRNF